jgi:pimeloyl-ACP methyl ester carboxylesterase
MELFYKELGEGEQSIIILHGLFGSSDNWQNIGKVFSERYKVYLLDLRNHGRSPHSDTFTYEAMHEDVQEFIEQHQIKQPIVMGHSMGGKVAMHVALSYPHSISKLVVVDICPKYYPVHHDRILEGLSSIDLSKISSRQEADEQLSKFERSYTVRAFLLKNLYRNEEGKFAWRLNLAVIHSQIENVGEAISTDQVFERPVLFINGAKSDYINQEDTDLIHTFFPGAVVETIVDAGHWVHAEKPDEFIAVTNNFIEMA